MAIRGSTEAASLARTSKDGSREVGELAVQQPISAASRREPLSGVKLGFEVDRQRHRQSAMKSLGGPQQMAGKETLNFGGVKTPPAIFPQGRGQGPKFL